jgi:hypothetical protein
MDVIRVEVTVHEKRNHPYEYGHCDCEVRLMADVGAGDDLDVTVQTLREKAAGHVRAHLDEWAEGIRRELWSARTQVETGTR